MKIKHFAVVAALAATLAACAEEARTTSSLTLAIGGEAVEVLVTHDADRDPGAFAEGLADSLAAWEAQRGGVLTDGLLVDLREQLPPRISAVAVAGPMGTCGEDEGGLTCIISPGVAEGAP